jgi:Glycosyl transferase family 2
MDADLDSLLTVVFCTADDLLPAKAGNARRIVTDAEVVTLAVAQVLLGRQSPLAYEHINLTGRYHLIVTDAIRRGEYGPLKSVDLADLAGARAGFLYQDSPDPIGRGRAAGSTGVDHTGRRAPGGGQELASAAALARRRCRRPVGLVRRGSKPRVRPGCMFRSTRVNASLRPDRVHGLIDAPALGAEIGAGALRVEGWALDVQAPLERALVIAGPESPSQAILGVGRPDVHEAAFPAVPHAAASGWRCDLDLRTARSGPLSLALVVKLRDGPWCEAASTAVTVTSASEIQARRPRAAFTIVKDEPVMLPLWLGYYGRHFAPGDLYVLDHDSTDGSTAAVAGRCQVVPVHRELAFDHRWLRGTVEAFQAFLLRSYETVLFAEVDEFLIPDPHHYRGLADYVERLARPAARSLGFNVVHQPGEPPLRSNAPILAQRTHWHASLKYSKRLVSRVPLRWTEGFHEELNAPDDPPDPHLMLVHLHRADYDWCVARHRASAARRWSPEDIARGDGSQNRIADPAEFDEWFRRGPDLDAPRELVPEHIRGLL